MLTTYQLIKRRFIDFFTVRIRNVSIRRDSLENGHVGKGDRFRQLFIDTLAAA
jgi:hypothetical protein